MPIDTLTRCVERPAAGRGGYSSDAHIGSDCLYDPHMRCVGRHLPYIRGLQGGRQITQHRGVTLDAGTGTYHFMRPAK
jgi:hypothetical protein